MRNIIIASLLLLCGVGAYAQYDPDYYSAMDGKSKEQLKAAAKSCVQNHTRLVYIDLPNYWQYSDVYPEKVNGSLRWWEMYSNEVYLIKSNQTPKSSFSGNGMQREHSVPKSWWKKNGDVEYTPAYSDMWNLYPSDGEANGAKSNYPLGVVGSQVSYDNGCTKVGVPANGMGGGAGAVFEPADEYKGDFARTFFYMATVYDDLPWTYTYMFVRSSYPSMKQWALDMLLQWARQDPVSQKEILRNDAVQKSQGNRNPFVDFPELAEFIWGTRTQEVFRISEQGGNVTPPITGEPELTSPVNGEWLDFGQVAVSGAKTSWLVLKGGNFTAPLSFTLGGVDRKMFTLSSRTVSAADINTTGEYMLAIEYTPTSEGTHEATLSIYDGGLDSSIKVNLKGEGCGVPTLSVLTATSPTQVMPTAYTANWGTAPEVVDYYVVTRKRYLEDGEETEEVESDTNSYRFTDRKADVMESYTVQSSRLGYRSEPSNSITVAASGVDILDAEEGVLGVLDNGFAVTAGEGIEGVNVYTPDGVCVIARGRMAYGESVELGKGLYLVTVKGMRGCRKLVVSGR